MQIVNSPKKLASQCFVILFLMLFMSFISFNVNAKTQGSESKSTPNVLIIQNKITLQDLATANNTEVELLRQINQNKLEDILYPGDKVTLPIAKTNLAPLPNLGNGQNTPATDEMAKLLNGTVLGNANKMETQVAKLSQAVGTGNTQNLGSQYTTEQLNIIENNALSIVNNKVNNQVNQFLGRFGTAETTISIDADGEILNSDFSLFSPVYDEAGSLIFSEMAVRRQEDNDYARTVGNFGLGYRHYTESELIGANIFIDHDFTGSNTRLGLGGEYWVDYAKLATNIYTPLSSWKESGQVIEHNERPATGYDIRGQAYLKNHPQLGGSLVFEHYLGDEVALFGAENRRSDPYALTAGIDYTPIPLVTAGVSHKMGKGGDSDTRVDVKLNLRLGVPIEAQLNPDNVVTSRTLMGNRYDLVDRNNEIVFEYQKRIFEVSILPSKYRSIADESQYVYTLDEIIDFESKHTSPSKIISHRWTITPIEMEMTSTADILSFKPTRLGKYSVRLELTNENGITAYSKPIIVQVNAPDIRKPTLFIDFIDRTDGFAMFDFNQDGTIAVVDKLGDVDNAANRARTLNSQDQISRLQPYNHHYIHFTVNYTDIDGIPIELDIAPTIHYQFNDTEKTLGANQDELILVDHYKDSAKTNVWHFVVATKNPALLDVVFFAQVEETFSFEDIMIFETEPVPPILGAEQYRITLQEMGAEGNTPGEMVLDTDPTNRIQKAIKQDMYYKATVYELATSSGRSTDMTWIDITAEVQHSLVWRYFNPADSGQGDVGVQIGSTEVDTYYGLEQCRGYTAFSTQVNNFQNNEMAWGKIGQTALAQAEAKYAADIDVLTEQDLQLAVQFDKSTRLKGKTELDDTKNICTDEVPASDAYYDYLLAIANTAAIKR